MTDDDSENKIILDKKLVPFLKNNNVSYHAFIDVLLSNKDYIKKETTVEKINNSGEAFPQLKSIGETQIRGRKTAMNIYKG